MAALIIAWALMGTVTVYDTTTSYPSPQRSLFSLLPSEEVCQLARQTVSQDLNRMEAGTSFYLECLEHTPKGIIQPPQ